MFDPTVFENLKIVTEGAVYDLDLAGAVLVTNRADTIDLASMGRTYHVEFTLREIGDITAVCILTADVKNLAGEILEQPSFVPGCDLELQFLVQLPTVEPFAGQIEELLYSIWGEERALTQRISYEYKQHPPSYMYRAVLSFQKTITEDHAEDIPAVIDHMTETLERINELLISLK